MPFCASALNMNIKPSKALWRLTDTIGYFYDRFIRRPLTLLPLFCCQELFYEDRHYHEHCFRCFRCDRSLADEPFTSQEDALLCNDCYCNEFSSKCVACDKIVMPGRDVQDRLPERYLGVQIEAFYSISA